MDREKKKEGRQKKEERRVRKGGPAPSPLLATERLQVNITKHLSFSQAGMQALLDSHDSRPLVLVFKARYLGQEDPDLGHLLMQSFLYHLWEAKVQVASLIFMHGAIHLCLEEADSLTTLQHLEKQGTEVLVCETSLAYYQAQSELAVGQPASMSRLVDRMTMAGVKTLVF